MTREKNEQFMCGAEKCMHFTESEDCSLGLTNTWLAANELYPLCPHYKQNND